MMTYQVLVTTTSATVHGASVHTLVLNFEDRAAAEDAKKIINAEFSDDFKQIAVCLFV